jgi:hypothetical protein
MGKLVWCKIVHLKSPKKWDEHWFITVYTSMKLPDFLPQNFTQKSMEMWPQRP